MRRGVIQLIEETNFKRDPVYWAIAAHELGHARFRIAHPASTSLTITAALVKLFLVRFGLGLALGNMLFAIPLATQLAQWMLGAALALHVLELADEVIASVSALRVLRADPALSRTHLRVARVALILLGWDRHLTPTHAWIVMLACSAATPTALEKLAVIALVLAFWL